MVLRPVVIFKGEGNVSAAEKRLYDDRVIVLFQKKGVTDEKVMVPAFQGWFPANASPVSIVQDAARYEMVDAVMEQFKKDALAAAKPAAEAKPKPKPKAAPKQLPITSFLR